MRLGGLVVIMTMLIVAAGCGRRVTEYSSFPVELNPVDLDLLILLDEEDGRQDIASTVAHVLERLNCYGWEFVCVAGNDVVVKRVKRSDDIGSFKVDYRPKKK
jgi:hypothetical protein